MRYAINGLLSLTCDGNPILGESEVRGLWTAAAVWIKEGPGVGRAVAEWMTHGHSEIDIHHSDIARFHDHQMRREHTRLRTTEAFIKTYGIIHPSEQYESDREQRLSPMYESQKKLGAFFYETAGWERPHWYESNANLLEEYGDAVMPREHEWDSRWWSPIINAEHLRMREAAGVIDLTAFCMFDIVGPGALESVQRTCVAAVRRRRRQGHLHAGPRPEGRLPVRPDRDAARGRPLPGRHRRRARHGRPQVVRRPARGRRRDDADRPDERDLDDRPVGPARPRHPVVADVRGRVGRGLRVPHLPRDRGQGHHRARVPHLLRRRAGLGAVRADGVGRRALGEPARGGRPARRRTGRDRRLRHHRPDREGLPRVRVRARRRAQHRRGRHAAAEGEGGRLRRQGGLPAPARGAGDQGRRRCCAR